MENKEDKGTEYKRRCEQCEYEFQLGDSLYIVDEAVDGPRGIVPLEMPLFFCTDKCLREHFDNGGVEMVSRRIP